MVKRAKTPPPDRSIEPVFYTITYPYPPFANLELPKDRMDLARWVACILGDPKYLFALYFKPSGHNHCIIEVSCNLPEDSKRALLGEHKWDLFLLNPSVDEVGKSSKIYYCHYKSQRDVDKEGWRRVDVQDAWFAPGKWRLDNEMIRHPYPLSEWCDAAMEDPTNKALCLNVPRDLFGLAKEKPLVVSTKPGAAGARLRNPATPVPGTPAWVEMKANGGKTPSPAPFLSASASAKKSAAQAPASANAWNKPIFVNAKASTNVWKTNANANASGPSSVPSSHALPAASTAAFAAAVTSRGGSVTIPVTPPDVDNLNIGVEDLSLGDRSWADDVEADERANQPVPEPGAGVWPLVSKSPGADPFGVFFGEEEEYTGGLGAFGGIGIGMDDGNGNGEYDADAAWHAAHNLPVLSREDKARAEAHRVTLSPPTRMYPVPVLNNEGGYSGGKGRSLFGDWKCPIHGELKVCPVGVCPEAGAEKARILRAQRKGNGGGGGGGGSGGMSPWTRNGSPAPRDDRDPLARAGTKGGVRVVDKGGQRRIGHGQSVPPGGKQNANAWTTVGRSSSRY